MKWPHDLLIERNRLLKVVRGNFRPGSMSVIHQMENPAVHDGRLTQPLYFWMSTFRFPDLHNIRVKEYRIRDPSLLGLNLTRIELVAVCSVEPLAQLMELDTGTLGGLVVNNCFRSRKPAPAIWTKAEAEFASRWNNGYQEIRLSFRRQPKLTKQVVQRKDAPRTQERKAGTMHWIWDAFVVFVCNFHVRPESWDRLQYLTQMSLDHFVGSGITAPFAELLRLQDGWIWVTP